MSTYRSSKRVRNHRIKKKLQQLINVDHSLDFLLDTVIVPTHCLTSTEGQESAHSECSSIHENEEARDLGDLFNNFNDSDIDAPINYSDSDDDMCCDYEWNQLVDHENFVANNQEDSESSNGSEVEENSSDDRECGKQFDEAPEIQDLRVWAIQSRCPRMHLDSLLKILKIRLLPEIPQSSTTFLGTSSAQYKVQEMLDAEGSKAEFCYMGIEKGLQVCVNPLLHKNKTLQLDFNIDGVKIKKSSPMTMWPILCKVYYSPKPRIYKPFAVSVFYGNGKPKDDNKFFEPFVSELNKLLVDGVSIKSESFRISIRCFVCDTPARSQVKCTKSHTSFNGCERCDTVAEKIDGVTVYTTFGNERTNDDFRSFRDINHHNGASPLLAIEPEINLVNQFVLDSMHLLYLGAMLRLFENWMSGDLNVKISATQKNELNRRTTKLKVNIPKEFARKMRPTNNYDKYKAVELRFFALYCGPMVLKKILPQELYDHFLLFHVACRLLSSKSAPSYTNVSRDYLKQFVESAVVLYGPKFVSLNIHNLSHLPDDVENMQCSIDQISAFPYESELGRIKNILLSPNRTVAQYCRRVHEERQILDQVACLPEETVILKRKNESVIQLHHKHQYFSTKHPDNSAVLKNGDIVEIVKMFVRENNIYLKVKPQRIKKSVYTYPCDSSLLDIYEMERANTNSKLKIVSLDTLSRKLVNISVNFSPEDANRSFVVPLLH